VLYYYSRFTKKVRVIKHAGNNNKSLLPNYEITDEKRHGGGYKLCSGKLTN
jgi:hypothetical protein